MRVLMITQHFYPSRGGLERQTLQLAKRLQGRGVDVAVVTARLPGLKAFEVVEDVPVYRNIGQAKGYASLALYLSSLLVFLLTRGAVYDLFHIQQALYPAFIGVLASKILRKKSIVKVTGSGSSGNAAVLHSRRLGPLLLPMIRQADVMASLSEETTREVSSLGFHGQIAEIPNGVDVDHFRPIANRPDLRRQLGLPEARIVFHAGRLSAEKGQDLLIRAWHRVAMQYADALLLIAGAGPERCALEEMTARLGIADRVRMLGEVADIAPYLAVADVFVLPSRGEGMSNALLEAMATGLPCLASDVGGNRQVIVSGANGMLFPAGDAAALADNLNILLPNAKLAAHLGRRARATVEQQFAFSSVTDRYIALYKNLLEARDVQD